MTATDCDVLIAGGGPAGSALALALADGRRRITVVEAQPVPSGGDARSIALSAASARLLDALGVWPSLAPDAVAIERVEVSQQGHFGRTRLAAADAGLPALGYVVAYDRLTTALVAAATDAPGVTWLAPARVVGTGADEVAIHVDIEADDPAQGGARHAALAVAADGTASPLREALGIATHMHDYQQTALITPVEAGGAPHVALERFTADGPLALLPRGGRRRTLIWTVPAARVDEFADLSVAEFAAAAGRRLGRGLGSISASATPVMQPLRRIEAESPTAARAVLVGNAARTLHPIGAQGFNLALRDVCTLAQSVAAADDPGAPAVLEAWRRARSGDQWRTSRFTDMLARGFHGGGSALAAARAGALIGLDLCSVGRQGLIAQTTGLLGGLPRVGSWCLERGFDAPEVGS